DGIRDGHVTGAQTCALPICLIMSRSAAVSAFNSGQLDADTAAERLMIRRSRLYELRHQWLSHKNRFELKASGGDHKPTWPLPAQIGRASGRERVGGSAGARA